MRISFEQLRDWLPVRCYFLENQTFIDWCYFDKERLTAPFFDDSVQVRFREPFNVLFRHQTPFDVLRRLPQGLKPAGFIFHLSRCGSTLVSQMLASLGQNIVISEASPIDFIVRKGEIDDEVRVAQLRLLINAYGQQRNAEEKNLFIKFDSWNTISLDVIRRAFPDVPWVFLYRNPVEIIVSHIRQRGAHMIQGLIPEILPELSLDEALRLSAEEYCARVMEKICRSALDALKKGDGLAINYHELPGAVSEKILPHFGVSISEKDVEKMLAVTKFNAKNPVMNFSADSESKKREASAAAAGAAENFVNPFFEELENIRRNPSANPACDIL